MMNNGISEISYLETLWGGPVEIGLGLTCQGGGTHPHSPHQLRVGVFRIGKAAEQ